jgi:hypothetical protein
MTTIIGLLITSGTLTAVYEFIFRPRWTRAARQAGYEEARAIWEPVVERAQAAVTRYLDAIGELPPEGREIHYRILWLKDRHLALLTEIEAMPQAQRDRLSHEIQRLERERRSLDAECDRLEAAIRAVKLAL